MERSRLTLRHLVHLAEHLAGPRLIESDLRVDDADGFDHARGARLGDIAGSTGCLNEVGMKLSAAGRILRWAVLVDGTVVAG